MTNNGLVFQYQVVANIATVKCGDKNQPTQYNIPKPGIFENNNMDARGKIVTLNKKIIV